MVEEQLDFYTEEAKKVTKWMHSVHFNRKHGKEFKETLKNVKEEHWESVDKFVTACIQLGSGRVLEFAEWILEKRKIIEWKNHPQMIESWLEKVEELGQRPKSDNTELHTISSYTGFVAKVVSVVKTNQMLKQFQDQLYQIVRNSLNTPDSILHITAIQITTQLPWEQNIHWCMEIFEQTYGIVQKYPQISSSHHLATIVNHTWMTILARYFQKSKEAKEFVKFVLPVFTFCKDQEWIDEDDAEKRTLSHKLLENMMSNFLRPHLQQVEIIRPFMPMVKELWKCDNAELQQDANSIITMAGSFAEDLLGDDTTDELIDLYLNGAQPNLIGKLSQMYHTHPEKFHGRIDEFAEAMQGRELWVCTGTLHLFWEISKKNPQAFSQDSIAAIAASLAQKDSSSLGLLSLAVLSENRPQDIEPHEAAIIRCMKETPNMAAQGANILVQLSALSEAKARNCLKTLYDFAQTSESATALNLIYNMRKIGSQHVEALAEYEAYFMEMKKKPELQEHAQGILDIIAGRTLEGISQEVAEQWEDIDTLDTRVSNTEDNVHNLGHEVDTTKVVVAGIRTDVDEQGTRLAEVEDMVEETVEKVEEIDKKTLSHAPTWSRDVAKLLNPKAEHDWCSLASRLNYKNDDIRNWATQPDPCLSLMDEWFATHRTKDATFAVLTALQEMNREDAAMIVENALKNVEDIVEDEEQDYVTPPSVFISYQWGLQPEVKMLKNHLEMAGFTCWLDVGQMGGGDKLFEKIDRGIRAADVMICCVSDKYAESPNCNREVNLAVTLGKPIIPLLMEKMSWPPPGSMGPIFGEYLFIRFFARPGETTGDNRYWPTAKFQELLMQLRYHVAPDHSIITDLYTDWWQPPEEVIVIEPKEQTNAVQPDTDKQNDKEAALPEIFISYQWGKQPQIKALYNILVSQGYTCWLDIMQMGGGDSLYDKIDRGIRGCKVILTCVTSKYALSANCRKEVSLAEALKKPIVPLLLEKMAWPPEGPMSMAFTQLLYIDFCKPDIGVQDHWNCPQMRELYQKIKGVVPGGTMTVTTPTNETVIQTTTVDNKQDNSEELDGKQTITNVPADRKEVENIIQNTTAQTDEPNKTGQVPVTPRSSCCVIQ